MARRLAAVLVAVAMLFVLGLPAALASSARPVLGSKSAFPAGKGFGTAKPRTVYLGGDPTGLVKSIIWHHWGAAHAVGDGTGWCPGPSVASGHPCPVHLNISKLATCQGRRAYINMAFSFKTGATFTAGSKVNACTGQFQQ